MNKASHCEWNSLTQGNILNLQSRCVNLCAICHYIIEQLLNRIHHQEIMGQNGKFPVFILSERGYLAITHLVVNERRTLYFMRD